MELNEFIEKFAEQFDETELDEWSSLIALSVIAMVDEEYDVQLKGDDIITAQSIGDLFEIVSSKAN